MSWSRHLECTRKFDWKEDIWQNDQTMEKGKIEGQPKVPDVLQGSQDNGGLSKIHRVLPDSCVSRYVRQGDSDYGDWSATRTILILKLGLNIQIG